jgi:hypothetical protein
MRYAYFTSHQLNQKKPPTRGGFAFGGGRSLARTTLCWELPANREKYRDFRKS